MRATLTIAVTALAVAGMVAAHEGVENPAVMERMQGMKAQGAALETLGGMARGSIAFDAARAAGARQALLDAARQTPALFRAEETDPKTEARPEIWANWADFEGKAMETVAAVEALDPQSVEGLAAGLRGVGAACSACHEAYRIEN